MALTRTFPTDSAGLPLADTRLLVAAMVESDTTGKPRAGVLPSHYNPLVTGTAGMAYSVAAFAAVTARAGMGAELVANDGAATVATTAAPGANSRIDVIWVRSLFTTTGDAGTAPVFGVTQGTAAASPSKPSIPAGALELATAVVLSTTTATSTAVITQTYPYTAMEGGVIPVRNAAELAAWAPADGSQAYQIDNGMMLFRTNGEWKAGSDVVTPFRSNTPVPGQSKLRMMTGVAVGTTNAGGVLAHTFPTPFPTACVGVQLMPDHQSGFAGGNLPYLVNGSVRQTGFQTLWPSAAGIAATLAYIAIGY
ncbi:hypothetical protein [Microbacterium lacticum]|uniref:gp53-like domain-containing protein n=1 Tax=Microbacterium lacticum TaxID=33885 RepID=UPI0028D64A88|nr:hypothetical protein [Microbacterium lacticum]